MKNKYKVDGDTVIIYVNCLGKTYECLISSSDFDRVSSIEGTWSGCCNKEKTNVYAVFRKRREDGSREKIYMHRFCPNSLRR